VPLDLWLFVSVAGIVEIHGRTLHGERWPARWDLAAGELEAIQAAGPALILPTAVELRAERARAVAVIEAWLGEPGALRGKRGVVSAFDPASATAIAAFEGAQWFQLPAAYRDLLLAANGIEIGAVVVLGVDDAYRLDLPGPDRLVIGPPDEDGALVLAPTGDVRWVALGDPDGQGRLLAPDLRAWVRARLHPTRAGTP